MSSESTAAPPPSSSTISSNSSILAHPSSKVSSNSSSSSPPPPNESPPSNLVQSPKSAPSPPPSHPPPPSPPPPSNDGKENKPNDASVPPPLHGKPPPSPSILSPPDSKNSDKGLNSYLNSNDDRVSISKPAAIGIAGGILVLIIIIVVLSFVGRKKKKKNPNAMQYYMDTSVRQGKNYYGGGQPTIWGNHDHMHPTQSTGTWVPPPLPLLNNTTTTTATDTSTGFSGPHVPPLPPPSPNIALGNKSTFTYEELAAATNGFAKENLLGQGGFGYVHKGVLPDGTEIAVKSLKSGSGQGEREFQAEIDIISRVHHRHLVSIVGYCISGSKRLLVYDFVRNKTLEYHLHGKGLSPMAWPIRLKIALGSAKGLAYLHEDCHPRIIHRDIKSANILLDTDFEALVADFGLAKLSADNNTHVSTRVMGTFGYLAPEYASSGKLTEKSDIFSFGVMLLEIITGKRPCDASHTFMEDSLVDWARPVLSQALSDGNYDELADPRLEGNYDPMEMARMVACAAAAVRHSARRRPKMSQIVRALDGDVSLEDLNEGMRPGQSMLFSSGSDYDSDRYTRRNMRKIPSPEYSGEYTGPIMEYGHHRGTSSSSDGLFSDELIPVGDQKLRAQPL